jgi:hypothetical protein
MMHHHLKVLALYKVFLGLYLFVNYLNIDVISNLVVQLEASCFGTALKYTVIVEYIL